MDLQKFFSSLPGQSSVALAVLLLLALIWLSSPKAPGKSRVLQLSVCSLLIAATFVINNLLPRFQMPQGGAVTLCGMLTLYLASHLFGPRVGILAGACYGLLDFLFSPYAYSPAQVLIDYPFAFGAIGAGGLVRNAKGGLYTGYALGVFGRFLASFASGALFFASYAPEGIGPIAWSAYYNGAYLGAELALGLAVMALPPFRKAVERAKLSTARALGSSGGSK
ncbi:MAG: energy-coupled thiamine transporter ThiT [Eubacteriaceae bacterium]|nr:energy-coupled thiamine transporter ThiT [Eubacteriaceae bacterium]